MDADNARELSPARGKRAGNGTRGASVHKVARPAGPDVSWPVFRPAGIDVEYSSTPDGTAVTYVVVHPSEARKGKRLQRRAAIDASIGYSAEDA